MDKHKVLASVSIKDAVRRMDEAGIGFCVCINESGKVIGVLSDGDFRRAVLNGYSLDQHVETIINKEFICLGSNYSETDVANIFLNSVAQHIPVIEDGNLLDILTEEKYFGIEKENNRLNIDIPAVIMAGGKGKRMDPFTRILPKPLIPVGDEPVIKLIMDEFRKYGINDFHISLNDKGRMIKAYFHDHELPYKINFIEEAKPLGTAGALKLLQGKFDKELFVSNCDIIIHTDYSSIVSFHEQKKYDLTLVASMRNYKIPYGICDVDEYGELISIKEKPEYDFLANAGLYLLNPDILNLIPRDVYFDMTDLIEKVMSRGLKVGVFPISEKSWHDVGQWPEYEESISSLKYKI